MTNQIAAFPPEVGVEVLDNEGYDVVLMSTAAIKYGGQPILFCLNRCVIPPLCHSIVDGHQVGVIRTMLQNFWRREEKMARVFKCRRCIRL